MVAYSELASFADRFIGRRSDFALQTKDGRYRRVGRPVTLLDLGDHLAGRSTMGTYVIDEQGRCSFAVYDADGAYGLPVLADVQSALAKAGVPSFLEQSRRGGHLWVFLSEPTPARVVRSWLQPFAPAEVEFYPKQNETNGYGSLMRVPLGVHRLSGRRYPFVAWHADKMVPYASTLDDMVQWCRTSLERVSVPAPVVAQSRAALRQEEQSRSASAPRPHTSLAIPVPSRPRFPYRTIADWCAAQDPFTVIGRYLSLDGRGMGHCPFTEHHDDGVDQHPSFRVYRPVGKSLCCWVCYTGGLVGDVFNFLERYHGLSAQELWRRIQKGEVS